MKRLAKYSLFAFLIFIGISVVVAMFAPSSTDISIEDFGPHEEADFSNEGAQSELAPEDRWMLQFIEPPANVESKKVYTFECELISRKPETLTTTCADFGEVVYKIKWTTWSVNGAKGTGVYSLNNCDPDCADGTRNETPVSLNLDGVTTDGTKYFLNTLTIISKDAVNDGIYKIWDVGEFYRNVPEMRG